MKSTNFNKRRKTDSERFSPSLSILHQSQQKPQFRDTDQDIDNERKAKSATFFTANAKWWVQEAMLILQSKGKSCLTFITLSFPGSTTEALTVFLKNASKAVAMLTRYIGNVVVKPLYCYVWEFQKRGALHLHYAVHTPAEVNKSALSESHLREVWFKILKRLALKSGVDLFERHNGGTWAEDSSVLRLSVEECTKSLVTYMSKESTKQPIFMNGKYESPNRWYGISDQLRQDIKRARVCECFHLPESDVIPILIKLRPSISSRWKVLRNRYRKINIGWSTKLSFSKFIDTRTTLLAWAKILQQRFNCAQAGEYQTIVFILKVNGYCELKVRGVNAYRLSSEFENRL